MIGRSTQLQNRLSELSDLFLLKLLLLFQLLIVVLEELGQGISTEWNYLKSLSIAISFCLEA